MSLRKLTGKQAEAAVAGMTFVTSEAISNRRTNGLDSASQWSSAPCSENNDRKKMRRRCHFCRQFADKLHPFPENMKRARLWAELLNWVPEFDDLIRDVDTGSIRLCSAHFEDSQYNIINGKERLRVRALPMDIRNIPKRQVKPFYRLARLTDFQEITQELNPPIKEEAQFEVNDPGASENVLKQEVKEEPPSLISESPVSSPVVNGPVQLLTDSKYFLCTPASVLSLIQGCLKCGDRSAVKKVQGEGETLLIFTICIKCGQQTWSSTPPVQNAKIAKYEGNKELISAVYNSGIPFEMLEDVSKSMKLSISHRNAYVNGSSV